MFQGTTGRHVYERADFFLQNDRILQDIVHDFTFNMFSVEGIEILETPSLPLIINNKIPQL
jgi:hypothetical protein